MSVSQSDQLIAARCAAASSLLSSNREEEALHEFRSLLGLTKNPILLGGICNSLGQIYCNLGQMKNAEAMFKLAHAHLPTSADALANLGLVAKWQGRLDEALRWLEKALEINPWHNAAQFTQAITELLRGNYKLGFDLYECRFRSNTGGLSRLETPHLEWDGRNGKNVYVYGEQGAGDIFLMLRYAKLIHALGIKQSWVVHNSMLPLVRGISEIDNVVGVGDPLPDFDCHIPAASLPRVFGTDLSSIPIEPYIPKPTPTDYGPGIHVGIVWRGNKTQLNDRFRSTALSEWLPVFDVPGVTFHSLQVDGADEGLLYPELQMHETPRDWIETAQRVAGLDLVISVDTSMVHLCGAMGVPCWCALHCRPYFVFPLVREDCPWYPSVTLFKQRKEFEWQPVFEAISNELKTLLSRKT